MMLAWRQRRCSSNTVVNVVRSSAPSIARMLEPSHAHVDAKHIAWGPTIMCAFYRMETFTAAGCCMQSL